MLGWFRKKKQTQEESEPVVKPDTAAEEPDAAPPSVPGDDAVAAQPEPPQSPIPDHSDETEPPDPEPDSGPAAVEADPDRDAKAEPEPAVQDKPASMFARLSERLSRTKESFTQRMDELFLGKKEINAELFDELEEILVTADLGIATTQELLEFARKKVARDNLSDPQSLKQIIKDQLKVFMSAGVESAEMRLPEGEPFVIMVVGVNGVGKTTTIGKIARKFLRAERSVLLVAADTFRAAATSQLKIWGERNGIRVIAQHEGADPSSVVYDAMTVAKANDYDVVLVDTAGRLHTKVNLMEELKKIKRVMNKQLADAPHEVLLVIDATTGQNGISQALLFDEAVGVSGIALTKLDGTAKGGIVANIARELQTPIRFIGVGEKVEDLRDFDADEFIEALFASE